MAHAALNELKNTELEQTDQIMSATLSSMGKIFSIGSNLEEQTHFKKIKDRYVHHPNEAFELLRQDLDFLKEKICLNSLHHWLERRARCSPALRALRACF